MDKASVISSMNESLLWGTYRPNLYFGTRPQLPESLLTGTMWFGVNDLSSFEYIRHSCEQTEISGGGGYKNYVEKYSYIKHDGRSFAIQNITDEQNNVILKIEFLKTSGGGDWAVRISGIPISEDEPSGLSLLYYFGLEGSGRLDLKNNLDPSGLNYPVALSGETPDLGNFTIKIIDGSDNQIPKIPALRNHKPIDLNKAQYWGHLVPKGDTWRAKDYLNNLFSERKRKSFADESDPSPPHLLSIPNNIQEDSNLYIFQLMAEAPFQFDILFKSTSSPVDLEDFTSILESKSKNFDVRFENTFGLASKGFDENQINFAHEILSNLIGGIGYFYGTSIVDRSYMNVREDEENFWDESRQANPKLTSPSSLFTATPSRPFFPRGFYWDEGFHQLLIGNWDNDLSLDIIKHWISLIDDDGWVAREQILGEESRSKVPREFQTQYPHYANPPTLLMPLEAFLDRLDNESKLQHSIDVDISPDIDLSSHIANFTNFASTRYLNDINLAEKYLKEIYSKLKLNYKWFRRTQRGEIKKWGRSASNSEEAYRWRGRTPGHTLTSGLDDYPRPTPPHPAELHVDLMCWVGFMARSLRDIAKRLDEWNDFEEFDAQYKNIVNNLYDLHWNEVDKIFCDISFDGEKSIYVCHKGYISLFPMLLGLLPNDSPKLDAILDLIYNPDELWSPYGLRSLSKSSEFYYTGEKYWRGPIWININYLALSSLYKNYIAKPGPYQHKADKIYKELRDNIIKNIYKEYKRTGYAWEQYSAINGEGARSHPFTGWTSLIVLIMAEQY